MNEQEEKYKQIEIDESGKVYCYWKELSDTKLPKYDGWVISNVAIKNFNQFYEPLKDIKNANKFQK